MSCSDAGGLGGNKCGCWWDVISNGCVQWLLAMCGSHDKWLTSEGLLLALQSGHGWLYFLVG